MPAPNLNDPAERAAYVRELQLVARPVRLAGMAFAVLGLALAVARRWVPEMPAIIPIAAIALGALNMLAGMLIRAKYHQKRMKGE